MQISLKEAQELLINELKLQGIQNSQVLEAIAKIPRHLFIKNELQHSAYENIALPIECNQTISQPYIVARMTELLLGNQPKLKKVLEIGTGSAYQTAVLSQVVDHVYSIERIDLLHQKAKNVLKNLNIQNVDLLYGDGYLGWPEHEPFDGIIMTAATREVPTALLEQLAAQGRMVLPLEEDGRQILTVIEHENTGFKRSYYEPVRFVPALRGLM